MADLLVGLGPLPRFVLVRSRRYPRPEAMNPKKECSVKGCAEPHHARGWCRVHYARWQRSGDPEKMAKGPKPAKERKVCSIAGCEEPHEARGWCRLHYARWRRNGDPEKVVNAVYQRGRPDACTVPDCDEPHRARGYCSKHYQRLMIHGDLAREIRRPNGAGTIDASGYVLVMVPLGTPNAYEYIDRSDGRSRRKARMLQHRLVMQEHLGRPLRPGESVHHKNGDRTDNRIENLELWAGPHRAGQRVEDLVTEAKRILDQYGDE
jgi:hypothetical protein